MKKETNMKPEAALAQTAETTPPAAFKCPKCMMGATCSDCDAYDYTRGFCDYHRTTTTGSTWACPAYYGR